MFLFDNPEPLADHLRKTGIILTESTVSIGTWDVKVISWRVENPEKTEVRSYLEKAAIAVAKMEKAGPVAGFIRQALEALR